VSTIEWFLVQQRRGMVAIFEFLELVWIFSLKALSDLNWKNITRPKMENVFSLKSFSVLKISIFAS